MSIQKLLKPIVCTVLPLTAFKTWAEKCFLNTLCGDANISHLVQNEEILVKNVPHVSLLCHSHGLKSIKF